MAVDKKNLIKELLENGKTKGKLTNKEITDALMELDFDVDQVEQLYETLEAMNVDIVDEPVTDPVFDATMASEDLENALSAEGINIDDPVKVYLKEIGRVALLSAE